MGRTVTVAPTNEIIAKHSHALSTLRNTITKNSVIHTRTTLGTGQRDYIRLYVVELRRDNPRYGRITDITYHASIIIGRKITLRGIGVNGVQFNKALEIADAVWRAVFGEHIDQTNNWEEIH